MDKNFIHKNIYALCASIQYTIVEILLQKIEKSIKEVEKLLIEIIMDIIETNEFINTENPA